MNVFVNYKGYDLFYDLVSHGARVSQKGWSWNLEFTVVDTFPSHAGWVRELSMQVVLGIDYFMRYS